MNATIDTYHFTQSELEDFSDKMKVIIVQALVNDGLIDAKSVDLWCANHTVIMRKKSVFRTISDLWKRKKKHESGVTFIVIEKSDYERVVESSNIFAD